MRQSGEERCIGGWARLRELVRRWAVVLWLCVTAAALVGMLRLWWTRERVLYFGKPVSEQRAALFSFLGMDPALLRGDRHLSRFWDLILELQLAGDPNTTSYLKYLLCPRLPTGRGTHEVWVAGPGSEPPDALCIATGATANTWVYVRGHQPGGVRAAAREGGGHGFLGLFAACCAVFGMAVGFALGLRRLGVRTWAGALALGLLSGQAILLASKCASGGIAIGGRVLLGAGLLGWWLGIRSGLWRGFRAHLRRFREVVSRPYVLISLLGIVTAVVWSGLMSLVIPDDWDCWAIWGGKAKVLALGAGGLRDVFCFGNPDYPLLWPTLWAFTGWCAGGWEEVWAKLWGPILLAVVLIELWGLVATGSGRVARAAVAVLALVSMPVVPLVASWGYAEPCLWLSSVAAWGLVLRWYSGGVGLVALPVIGLLMAASAYAKNEGLAFSLVLVTWMLVVKPARWREAGIAGLVFAGAYAPWMIWVRFVNSWGVSTTGGFLSVSAVLDSVVARVAPAISVILQQWSDVRQWNVVLPVCVAFCGVRLIVHPKRNCALWVPVAYAVLALGFILLGENDVAWQLGMAWPRVTIETAMLLIPALFSATPDQTGVLESRAPASGLVGAVNNEC